MPTTSLFNVKPGTLIRLLQHYRVLENSRPVTIEKGTTFMVISAELLNFSGLYIALKELTTGSVYMSDDINKDYFEIVQQDPTNTTCPVPSCGRQVGLTDKSCWWCGTAVLSLTNP